VQEISRHKRGVTVDDEDAVHTGPGQFGKGLPEGVSRAELLLLQDKAAAGDGLLDHLGLVSGDNPDVAAEIRGEGVQDISQHRFAENVLKNLGKPGMHAGSLSGG